jgi:hypothetical protein
MNNCKKIVAIVLTGIFLGGYSCKSSKEITGIALQKMTKEERLNSILFSELQYNTISSNLKFTVKPGTQKKEISVDAQLRIIKNEAIQFSLRIPLLGTEAFKILITPEQILVIDRLNKQYLSESMKSMKEKVSFDFDYYSLEALLTNRLFIAGKKEIIPANYPAFKIREDNFSVDVINTDRQGIQYSFTSDYSNRIQQTQLNQEKWKSHLQCQYTHWGLASNKRSFPMQVNLILDVPDDTYKMNLSFYSVDINPDFTIDYHTPNPDKYRQVTLQQIVKLIGGLL